MQNKRKEPALKANEIDKKQAYMQNKRKDPAFKANEIVNERAYMQNKRKDPAFKANEIVNERALIKNKRKDLLLKQQNLLMSVSQSRVSGKNLLYWSEIIKKQQHRQQKRKLDEMSAFDDASKRCNRVVDSSHSHKSYKSFDQEGFKSSEERLKQFHSNIVVVPLFVFTCFHQTWFRKSVSVLNHTHTPAQSKRLYCTKFASVNDDEWVCHTCLTALRNNKAPKLSVINRMRWPENSIYISSKRD